MSIRVAIVDDHPAVLAGIEQALDGHQEIAIVGAVPDSSALVELLNRQQVDVVLADFSMPAGSYGDGIVMLSFLRRRFPQVRLAVLTSMENPELLRNAVNTGVVALISKADDFKHIEIAVRSAYTNAPYFSPRIDLALSKDSETSSPRSDALSKRESEVLRMLAEGLSIIDISRRVERSPKTISTQKMSAMKKLGLSSDAEIFSYAIASGMIQATRSSREGSTEKDGDTSS